MKTMLNRNSIKKAFPIYGLLVMIAFITMSATRTYSGTFIMAAAKDTTEHLLKFDSVMLELSGAQDEDLIGAPEITMNQQAEDFVTSYLKVNERELQKIKDRSEPCFTVMDQVFAERNLPQELKYLAVIESQLKTKIVSKAGAVGAWQFMPVTARHFKLKIGGKNDERTNVHKSTIAAAKYLEYLYKIFGDWLLVVASYNSGPGKVLAAIKKSGSRDFWKLQQYLPKETRAHVKKFISTHYFFEGEGGICTVTRAEADAYRKTMNEYVANQNKKYEELQRLRAEEWNAENSTGTIAGNE
jgi:membrane-bound lytic murein transglycosylase D